LNFKQFVYKVLLKVGVGFFMKLFPEYFAREPLAPNDRYIETTFVIQNLPKPPAKILDVGSSGSFFPLTLSAFGYDTYGMDIRNYAITNRIAFKNFTFIREDIRRTTLADTSFDVVTAISTVEHIGLYGRYGVSEDAWGDKMAIEAIKRVLRPHGTLLMTVPFGKARVIKPYNRIYDGNRIKDITRGFTIDKEEYYMQDIEDNWYQCSKSKAESIDATSDRGPICLLKMIKEK